MLPGREGLSGQPPESDFAAIVQRISDEIRQLSDRPYALFGHSLGATLAFEVSCQLERCGSRAPSCLIVSGRSALHLPDSSTDEHSTGDGERPASSTLPDAEFIALLHRMGGTRSEILDNSEMIQFLLPLIRADFRLSENYCWDGQSRSACPVLVLGGKDDTYANPEELAAWSFLTIGDATVRMFEGGHFFIASREEEVCSAVAAFVDQQLQDRQPTK